MLYLSLPLTKGAIKNRSGSENRSELEISPTFLLMNSNEEMKQSGHLKLESLGNRLGFPGRLANPGLFPFLIPWKRFISSLSLIWSISNCF